MRKLYYICNNIYKLYAYYIYIDKNTFVITFSVCQNIKKQAA